MSSSRKKILVISITAVAIAAVATALTLKSKTSFLTGSSLPAATPISTQNQPTLGQSNAPLHLVVFEDLKCGNCKNYSNLLFPKIKQQYIDTGKAQYTTILLAFINGSIPAANAALCLREQSEDYFYPFIKYLYKNQPPETENWTTIPRLLITASQAVPTANRESLSDCLFENKYAATLESNRKEAAKVMNQQIATPSLYVNGVKVQPLTMDRIAEVVKVVQ